MQFQGPRSKSYGARPNYTTTSSYRVNKSRRLRFGSICFPLNDSHGYARALRARKVWTLTPLDHTAKHKAMAQGLLNRVVLGNCYHTAIEGVILDEETGIPWQVPEALVKYKAVDYLAAVQPYSRWLSGVEESPVSPKHCRSAQQPRTESTDDGKVDNQVQMSSEGASETTIQPVATTKVDMIDNKGKRASLFEEADWAMFLSIPEET